MASTYLSRTPASAGNRKTWTWSGWVKRSKLSATQTIFSAQSTITANQIQFYFNSNDTIILYQYSSSGAVTDIFYSTEVQFFRDISAWYHVVLAVDTTQATNTNRVKLYINGNSNPWLIGNPTHPSQNLDTYINATNQHRISVNLDSSNYFDGLMANVYLVDGQQLTPSSFGETDATTGIWKPKPYSGSYGTNGFFLKFENSGSMGTDSSSNGNNFTVGGGTLTQTVDTPSNVFATWNPLAVYDTGRINILTNGNTSTTDTSSVNYNTSYGSLSVSKGKWYWEIKPTSLSTTCALGVYFGLYTGGSYPFDTNVFGCHQNGQIYYNGNTYAYMASYTSNDIVTFALDMDNGKFYMGKNGSWANGSGSTNQTFANAVSITDDIPASFPTGKDVFPIATVHTATANVNFGNGYFGSTAITSPVSDTAGLGKFQYAVPAGYYSLCTKNINSQG